MTPGRTRLGLLLPGLGHLAMGEWTHGLGLMSLVGLLAWSLVAGAPRFASLAFPGPGPWPAMHPWVALVSWATVAGGLWWVAYKRAFGPPLGATANANLRGFLHTMSSHRAGMVGLYGVLFFLVLTLLTPLMAPFDPIMVDAGPRNLAPTWTHWMGTDQHGRDVLSRLLYGARISLPVGFLAVGIAATLGTTLGALAGYLGGIVDAIIMFVVDGLIALPRLALLITVVALFRFQDAGGILLIVLVLGFTGWMGIARIVRSEVLSLKERDFIQACRALGMSPGRILFRHLVPNTMGPVIVYSSLAIGGAMLVEASLSFLGLGVQPPTATWGVMVADGQDPLRTAPWIAGFPGMAITLAVLSFNLLGDGLRDATDPRLRGTA